MSYLKRIGIFFQAFIFTVTSVIAQHADVLPVLKPSYTHDLLQGKQGIKVDCIADVYPDSQGRLWLQTCGQTSVKELRFVQYDGYRFDQVATRIPQHKQDYDLHSFGVSPYDQLYGRYESSRTGEMGLFLLELDSREVTLRILGQKNIKFTPIFNVIHIADSSYLISMQVDNDIQFHTLRGTREQTYITAEDVPTISNYDPRIGNLLVDLPTEIWYMRNILPLVRVDKTTRSIRKYKLPDFSERPDVDAYLATNTLSKLGYMVVSKTGEIYLYFGHNLYQLDRLQDRFISILSEFPSTYSPLGLFQDKQENICFVFEDEEGKLQAVLQDTNGDRFNYSSFFTHFSRTTLANVVSEDFFREVYVCGQGGLLHMYVQEPTTIQTVLDGYFISSVIEMPTGEFLINTVLDGWFILSHDLREVRPFTENLSCEPAPCHLWTLKEWLQQ